MEEESEEIVNPIMSSSKQEIWFVSLAYYQIWHISWALSERPESLLWAQQGDGWGHRYLYYQPLQS